MKSKIIVKKLIFTTFLLFCVKPNKVGENSMCKFKKNPGFCFKQVNNFKFKILFFKN